MSRLASACLLVALTTVLLVPERSRAQQAPGPAAGDLAVQWAVRTNLVDDGARFRSRLTLANNGETTLPATGWTLYFNFLRPIDPASVTGGVEITRINGDFCRLTPGEDFAALPPGQSGRSRSKPPGPPSSTSTARPASTGPAS